MQNSENITLEIKRIKLLFVVIKLLNNLRSCILSDLRRIKEELLETFLTDNRDSQRRYFCKYKNRTIKKNPNEIYSLKFLLFTS